jgi:hypothetical protein
MSKVDLAKKTAKLMVEKLSPKELENELYQLLILLSNDDLEYAHTDIESGNIAGSPDPLDALHPVDALQGSDDRYEEDERDSINMKKEQLTQQEIDKKYDEFSSGDFVYGYDSDKDRWLPYTLISYNIGDDGGMQDIELQEYFIGAPSFNSRGKTIDYNGEIRKQPEDKVFLLQDYLYENRGRDFMNYVKKNSELVKDVYLDPMSGTLDIYWNDPDMKGFTTQATPFWYDEETIPVQVSGKDGDPLENNGPEYYNSVYFGTNPSFNLGNGIYPNNPNDFYQAYVDTLSETLDKSKMIVKNEKNKK